MGGVRLAEGSPLPRAFGELSYCTLSYPATVFTRAVVHLLSTYVDNGYCLNYLWR